MAGLLNVILFSALGILAFYSVMMALTIPDPVALGFLVGFAVSMLCLHALMRRGHVRLAI